MSNVFQTKMSNFSSMKIWKTGILKAWRFPSDRQNSTLRHMYCKLLYWEKPFTVHVHVEIWCTVLLLMYINSGLGANPASITCLAVECIPEWPCFATAIAWKHAANHSLYTPLDIQAVLVLKSLNLSFLARCTSWVRQHVAFLLSILFFHFFHRLHMSPSPSYHLQPCCCALYRSPLMSTFPPASRWVCRP